MKCNKIFAYFLTKGLKVEVIPSKFEENLDKSKFEHPWDYVKENAAMKALTTAKSLLHDKVKWLICYVGSV